MPREWIASRAARHCAVMRSPRGREALRGSARSSVPEGQVLPSQCTDARRRSPGRRCAPRAPSRAWREVCTHARKRSRNTRSCRTRESSTLSATPQPVVVALGEIDPVPGRPSPMRWTSVKPGTSDSFIAHNVATPLSASPTGILGGCEVRDDARAARQLVLEARPQPEIHVGREKQRHHARAGELGGEQVLARLGDAPSSSIAVTTSGGEGS